MHVIKARSAGGRKNEAARATGQIKTQQLLDLIDESAPDEAVVDVHEIESRLANGSRRIPLPAQDAAVVAVVEGASDTTRRMSAVDLDAAVAAVEAEVHSESTMRMSAIQANQLAALITPVEVSLVDEAISSAAARLAVLPPSAVTTPEAFPVGTEPVVRFAPSRPLAPVADDTFGGPMIDARAEQDIPVRGTNWWLVGGIVAVLMAALALAAVAL